MTPVDFRRAAKGGFVSSAVVAGAFFGLVAIMAFRPQWLARPLFPGGVFSLGLAATLGFLILAFLVMGGYVVWRGRH